MNDEVPYCPKCRSPYSYNEGQLWICPECFHEWNLTEVESFSDTEETPKFVDVNGVALENGDSVVVAKDLKVGKTTLKSGTKVRNIRLLDEPVNDHDISCKVDGHGQLYLKCSVVKKSS